MANEIALIEKQLTPLAPRFDAFLRGSMMDSRALIQMMVVATERSPRVAECTLQSLINCANTAAVLRLPIDGATGQFFPLPFRNKGVMTAQPCIGYKGYSTIAARSGVTITGGVAREGDHEFDYLEGTGGFVRHKKKLDNKGKIIAAWAAAAAADRPPVVSILGIGEIEAVMKRSPAFRGNADTPWKDPEIGFPAMAEKTAKRRLARSIPYEIDNGNFQRAARLEEAFDEQGKSSWIGDRSDVMVGEVVDTESHTPTAATLTAPRVEADPVLEAAKQDLYGAAEHGTARLLAVWSLLPREVRVALQAFKDEQKRRAERVDMGHDPDDEGSDG